MNDTVTNTINLPLTDEAARKLADSIYATRVLPPLQSPEPVTTEDKSEPQE